MKFKLLRDLPNLKAGAIFELWGTNGDYIHASVNDSDILDSEFTQREVEDNPDWFEKVEEPINESRERSQEIERLNLKEDSPFSRNKGHQDSINDIGDKINELIDAINKMNNY